MPCPPCPLCLPARGWQRWSLAHRRHSAMVGFSRADADHLIQRHYEDLAVADVARLRPPAKGIDGGLDERIGDRDLEADLLGQLHLHRHAAVGLDAVELAPVALDAAYRQATHIGAVEGLEDVVGLLGTNDADHELHSAALLPSVRPSGAGGARAYQTGSPARPALTGSAF